VGDFPVATDPAAPDNSPMLQMSLDRLRQLAAHEVGHTLGLPHNYLASTQGRASVMDYPTMLVKVKGAGIDLSDAYAKGIGAYDKWSIRYGYEQFAAGTDEKSELTKLVTQMQAAGLSFLTDQDARPEGSVHPATHLWDNGANAVDELRRVMDVRNVALSNFTEKKIPVGMPMATLEEVFVPMYMFHRYQVESAVKVLGGQAYTNALRGDQQAVMSIVPAAEQNRALSALVATLEPGFLAVPSRVLAMIPPRPFRFDPNPREVFRRHTGLAFDAMAPPEAAAGLTLRLLMNPERCARLAVQKARDPRLPDLNDVFEQLYKAIVKSPALTVMNYAGDIARMTERMYVDQLIKLATSKETDGNVRAVAHGALVKVRSSMNGAVAARDGYVNWVIAQYLSDPDRTVSAPTMTPPDGAPIDPGQEWLSPDCEWR
jgi:Met-zincin